MIKVLLVDDHPIVREGVKRILAAAPEIEVADEAASAREALDKARRDRFDVAVIDIGLPDRSGLSVIPDLKYMSPCTSIVVLSLFSEEQYGIRAFKSGASAYLEKKSAPVELIAAIRKVAAGGKYVSERLAEKVLSAIDDLEKEPHERLSDREHEIMRGIASGRTVSEMAEALSLSVKTVSTYRSRILQKTGLKNNAEIMRYAMEKGLI